MRRSTTVPSVMIALAIAGVATLPAEARSCPREQPTPSGDERPASGQPRSTPKKQEVAPIEYRNLQYGFCFSLPEDWRGYTIVLSHWQGRFIGPGSNAGKIVQHGPIISIRDPRWTSAKPRQGIPIMVFTQDQWRSVQHEEISVSAAPIGPTELGRNSRYIFALPPRYNFRFLAGYKEVEQILKSKPLHRECQSQ
jgi:hypothetical protein